MNGCFHSSNQVVTMHLILSILVAGDHFDSAPKQENLIQNTIYVKFVVLELVSFSRLYLVPTSLFLCRLSTRDLSADSNYIYDSNRATQSVVVPSKVCMLIR